MSFGRFVPLFRAAPRRARAPPPASARLRARRARRRPSRSSPACVCGPARRWATARWPSRPRRRRRPAAAAAARLVAARGDAALRADLLLVAAFFIVLGVLAAAGPAAAYLWLVAATGNGNHAYFLGLAHCLAASVLATKALAWHVPRRRALAA